MNLNFKSPLQKPWTILEDRLIYGDKEFLFTEITDIKLFDVGTIGTGGCIHIFIGQKVLNLAYSSKQREEGYEAFLYLEKAFAKGDVNLRRKTKVGIQKELDLLPNKNDWGTKKEISELHKILSFDESIKAITSGLTNGSTWLIVCTDRRVLMIDKGMVYGVKLIEIPLDRITSITHSKGLLLGEVSITEGAVTRIIKNIPKNTVSFFTNTVNIEIENRKKSSQISVTKVLNEVSIPDEILKYKQLLDIGVLTQEEFDMKKKELLDI